MKFSIVLCICILIEPFHRHTVNIENLRLNHYAEKFYMSSSTKLLILVIWQGTYCFLQNDAKYNDKSVCIKFDSNCSPNPNIEMRLVMLKYQVFY